MVEWRSTIPIVTATAVIVGAIAADVLLSACDRSPTGPSPQLTVIISGSGVSPAALSETRNSRVEFVNQDSQPHDIRSDPHPGHYDRPELNVGVIEPGQSRITIVIPGSTSGAWGYHDETRPDDPRFHGSITLR